MLWNRISWNFEYFMPVYIYCLMGLPGLRPWRTWQSGGSWVRSASKKKSIWQKKSIFAMSLSKYFYEMVIFKSLLFLLPFFFFFFCGCECCGKEKKIAISLPFPLIICVFPCIYIVNQEQSVRKKIGSMQLKPIGWWLSPENFKVIWFIDCMLQIVAHTFLLHPRAQHRFDSLADSL